MRSRRLKSPAPRDAVAGRGGLAAGLLLVAGLLAAAPLAAGPESAPAARALGAVIPIEGEINDIVRDSIQRRIDEARAAGATTLIFEMNTPGGLVSSALDICRIVKSQPAEVRTVAWVHPHAYSAGAMISVACNEIWMSPSASIGDCAPIMVTPGGIAELGETERAKAESPILQEFRDSAIRNGYDPLLSRAMVTVGEEVWWVERINDPSVRKFIDGATKKRLVDEAEEAEREWKLVESYTLPGTDEAVPAKQPVDSAGELLTLSQYDAVAYGFAKGIAVDVRELAGLLRLEGTPATFQKTGWEKFAIWLNSPLLRGLLLVIVFIGAYLEFQSPGLILPGATALIALAIFLAAPYAAGLATFWPILVLALGVVLLAVEVLVIPGFGVAGILGILLIGAGVIGSFVPYSEELPTFSPPNLRQIGAGVRTGVAVLGGSILASVIGIVALAYYLPKSKLARGVILSDQLATMPPVRPPEPEVAIARVGDVGVVTGDLRPAGQARFGQEIVDVRSQGEYVESGRRVQVMRREGMTIMVRPLPEDSPQG